MEVAPIAVLLGAGASAEANLPTSREISKTFEAFSSFFPDDEAVAIENLYRETQVQLGRYLNRASSTIDFEMALGTIVDIATRKLPLSVAPYSAAIQERAEQNGTDFVTAANRSFALLRSMLASPPKLANASKGLLSLRRAGEKLDIFTLNFDTSLDRELRHRRIRFTDGFRKTRGRLGMAVWLPREFANASKTVRLYKLHGSLDWAFLYPSGVVRPADLGAYDGQFAEAYPRLVRVLGDVLPRMEMPGADGELVSAMNFGTRKELLYSSSPFAWMFSKFTESLSTAKVLVVAGYSFRDDRVNLIIEEALVLRRGALRLVVVDPAGFRLEDSFPLLFEFRREDVATILETGLSEALGSGELQLAVRKSRLSLPQPPSKWASKLPTLDSLAKVPERDVESLLGFMRQLQADLDRLVWQRNRSWEQMGGSLKAKSLPAAGVASACEPLIACAARIADRMDQIKWAMGFGVYFGQVWLDSVNPHPNRVGRRASDQGEALQGVVQWVDYAFRKFMYAKDEFLEGVSDPSYGAGTNAPDNWSMAELVLRDILKGVREAVFAIGRLFEVLGYERGLPWPIE